MNAWKSGWSRSLSVKKHTRLKTKLEPFKLPNPPMDTCHQYPMLLPMSQIQYVDYTPIMSLS